MLPVKQQNNGLTIDYIQEYNCIDCWEALNFSKAARPKTLAEMNPEIEQEEIDNNTYVTFEKIKEKYKNKNSYYFNDYVKKCNSK